MRGNDIRRDGLFSYVRPESRIPANHPLRLIRRVTDEALAALDTQFAALYAENGRPSIPPELPTSSAIKPTNGNRGWPDAARTVGAIAARVTLSHR